MDSVLKLSEITTWGMSKVVAEIFFIIYRYSFHSCRFKSTCG